VQPPAGPARRRPCCPRSSWSKPTAPWWSSRAHPERRRTHADEKPLRQVIEAIGDDTIVEEFTHLEGVSDKSKAKILWDNCARLYNLAGPA
jgi:hypothetical protein